MSEEALEGRYRHRHGQRAPRGYAALATSGEQWMVGAEVGLNLTVAADAFCLYDLALEAFLAGRAHPRRTVLAFTHGLARDAALEQGYRLQRIPELDESPFLLRHRGGPAVTSLSGAGAAELDPARPALIAATLGELGRCLLARGGREFERPLFAALVGSDALVVCVGVSALHPTVATLRAVRARQGTVEQVGPGMRVLAAPTAPVGVAGAPSLGRGGPRPRVIRRPAEPSVALRAKRLVAAVRVLRAEHGGERPYAVVADDPECARRVHKELQAEEGDAALFIAAQRPVAAARLEPVLSVLRGAKWPGPRYVVATHGFDQGAGLRLAGLVCDDAAPSVLDARIRSLGVPAGRVVALSADAKEPEEAPEPRPAVLTGAHLYALARTAPEPYPSPILRPLLTGERGRWPEIQRVRLVWRADLVPARPKEWAAIVHASPPAAGEAAWVTRTEVIRWLEGVAKRRGGGGLASYLSAGRDGGRPSRAKPAGGQTIVVPADYGGCDLYGFAPESTAPVEDLLHEVESAARRVARFHPRLGTETPALGAALAWRAPERRADPLDEDEDEQVERARVEPISTLAREATEKAGLEAGTVARAAELRKAVRRPRALRITRYPDGRGLIVSWPPAPPEPQLLSVTLDEHHERCAGYAEAIGFELALGELERQALTWAARHHDLALASPVYQREIDPRAIGEEAMRQTGPRRKVAVGHEIETAGLLAAAVPDGVDADLALHLIASSHGRARSLPPAAGREPTLTRVTTAEGASCEGLVGAEPDGPMFAERFARLDRRYGLWGLCALEAVLRGADRRAHAEHARGIE